MGVIGVKCQVRQPRAMLSPPSSLQPQRWGRQAVSTAVLSLNGCLPEQPRARGTRKTRVALEPDFRHSDFILAVCQLTDREPEAHGSGTCPGMCPDPQTLLPL